MSGARAWRRIGAALVAVVLSLLACELVVRVVTRRDDAGQLWLGSQRLLPYRLRLDEVRTNLEKLRDGDTFLTYDADLGWAPRPNARSTTGPFAANGAAVRAERETAPVAVPGTLRVAAFGDSFTFGDEVGPGETWAAALEHGLAARGVRAEVLNFGVNAYGIDQAYLRWRRDGRRFRPDVVILGFQPENALRDRNVFRPLYYAGTEVPLSKPRFVVRDAALELHNVTTLPPDEIEPVLAGMPAHPLFAYEGFAAPYAPAWWLHSRLLALAASASGARGTAPFQLDGESRELSRRIVAAFAADVTADGAAPRARGRRIAIRLPRRVSPRSECWKRTAARSGRRLPLGPHRDAPLLQHRREHAAANVDEEREEIVLRGAQGIEDRRWGSGRNDGGSKSGRNSGRVLHRGSFRFWFGDHRPFGGQWMEPPLLQVVKSTDSAISPRAQSGRRRRRNVSGLEAR